MRGSCLIGYTGFVGGGLLRQRRFEEMYRSVNIEGIRGKEYGLLVCAGAPAAKWKANRDPEADWANLRRLIEALRTVRAERAVLLSTVDVFGEPWGVEEDTVVDPDKATAYGRHRFWLEEAFQGIFRAACVVRLPGLFGAGLRKNFLYDLLANPEALRLTHSESEFQFYDTGRLWGDIERALELGLRLVHLASEPVRASEVAWRAFGRRFENKTEQAPVRYDMQSGHARALGGRERYLTTAGEICAEIWAFAKRECGAVAV